MKRLFLLPVVFLALVGAGIAQQPADPAFHRKARKAIEQFAWSGSTPWMENYAWLQQQEMPYFARDTFTMTWRMDARNLIIRPDSGSTDWTATFDPTWPNGSRHPIAERYELRGQSCRHLARPGLYLEDIGFEFRLDSALRVMSVRPLVEVRANGYLRQLSPDELEGIDCSECIKVTYLGEEATRPTAVGAHHRIVRAMLQRTETEKEKIARLLDRAVREHYAGFRILSIEPCDEPGRICWFDADATARSLRTHGRITAATGPGELRFEAVFYFPDEEEPSVDEVRIFK